MSTSATSLSNVPVSGVDTGILLEAGTNEAEVLVFRIRGKRFGVNVAKVREVLPIETVTDIPKSHPAVDGLVEIRETVVPLVNLGLFLYNEDTTDEEERSHESLILLEFNDQQNAFRVQEIERIYRVSWKDTLPAPQLGQDACPVTSILRQKEGLVPLLDFESICAIIGIGGMDTMSGTTAREDSLDRAHLPIVFADDSRLICEMIKDSLVEGGYSTLKGFADGQEAWDYLEHMAREYATKEKFKKKVACVVTDIEMPRMDGLSFTKRIRKHPVMGDTPVVLFSSIATQDNAKKGEQVGASIQVAKPHYDDLLNAIDDLLQDDGS